MLLSVYHLQTPEINHGTSHLQFWEPVLVQLRTQHSSFLIFCQNIETAKTVSPSPPFFFTVTSRLLMSSTVVADRIHAGQDLPAIRRLPFLHRQTNYTAPSWRYPDAWKDKQQTTDCALPRPRPLLSVCRVRLQSAAAAAAATAECLSRSLVECLCN